jgi:hypothetical protein
MKKVLVATALALFGLAPAISAACDYNDESSASTTPPEQFASAPKPAATKVPAPAVAKTLAPNAVKPVAAKTKISVPDQKIAAGTTN